MYSKKAIWAFILCLLPLIIGLIFLVSGIGYDRLIGRISSPFDFLIAFVGPFVGMILAIKSFKTFREFPDLQGKGLAKAALVILIVHIILFIFSGLIGIE